MTDALLDPTRRSPKLKVAGQIDLGRTASIPIHPDGVSDPWWIRGVTAGDVLAVTLESLVGAEAVGLAALVQEGLSPATLTEAGGWLGATPVRPGWTCYLVAQEPGGRLIAGAAVRPAGLPAARVRVERLIGWRPPVPCAEFEGSWTFYAGDREEGLAAAEALRRALRQVEIRWGREGVQAGKRLAEYATKTTATLGGQVVVAVTVERRGLRPEE